MDLVMEEMDGIDSTKAILKDVEAKIIIVTSFIDDEKCIRRLKLVQRATY